MEYRIEKDSMGEIKVPADKLWGAQTQRSYENFQIGTEKIPSELVTVFAYLKKAAALVNKELGVVDSQRADAIAAACDDILAGRLDGNFPLAVWMTGSGTQFNMNVNEVVAHRAMQILKEKGEAVTVHPNDHVNHSQSSNDIFPTALYVAGLILIKKKLFPAMEVLFRDLHAKAEEYMNIVKIGRTHLQDATPLTLGQEFSGWARMIERDKEMLTAGIDFLRDLAMGGTAVGTGINCPEGYDVKFAAMLSTLTGETFHTAPNKFQALTSKDELVTVHGMLKALACDLMKIANDVRWLASGPRCGIGEITIPENEPGSSIMPSKVNPTQCEAVTMVAVQVMGNDAAMGIAASQGNFQLNVFMPVMAYNLVQSIRILSDVMDSFRRHCVVGIQPNLKKIDYNLHQSLILVTGLVPLVGYDKACMIAKKAAKEEMTLREAAVETGWVTAEQFDTYMDPAKLAGVKK
ncbi:fumarate hydratase [Megasphaera cerevisiae DSM 20462]|uniref:Fumarate hydratase class II n=1 Tax=Megasphaera cerevisiae DSM 20462 TaxID=1122219 RepID=A0A0J6X008_9FIRM|nr:class II fumarate hydratase [Megasphaera cerevisiae]KMO87477.1 fumarate hydratase [Megasphaera cerevisiae DSM 20462]SJZ37209.1 fumarase, class II [Megasphaera cerevisiae DSM 20462]